MHAKKQDRGLFFRIQNYEKKLRKSENRLARNRELFYHKNIGHVERSLL